MVFSNQDLELTVLIVTKASLLLGPLSVDKAG